MAPRFARPTLVGDVLAIHPIGIVRLLAHFADPSESNEFDLSRLKANAVGALKKVATRKKTETIKGTYQSCLRLLQETKIFGSPYLAFRSKEQRQQLRRII